MVHLLLLVDSEDFDMYRLWNMALVLAVRGGAVLQQLRPANASTNSERCAIRELRTGAYPAISTAAICGSFCSGSTMALCGTYRSRCGSSALLYPTPDPIRSLDPPLEICADA